jgi:hypothetical protein
VRDQVCETATPTGRTAGRTTAKNSLNAIQEHRSGEDDRRAIDEMTNSTGRRHKMRISVQDKLIVRISFGVLDDDIALTYMCDVMQPPLPPLVVPPNSPTKRAEPFEPLSVIDQVGTEMLKVLPALNDKDTPEMCALAHVSTELTRGVEPHEPLSASDHIVAEMFAVPPVLQTSHNATSTQTLSVFDQVGTDMPKASLALDGRYTIEARAFTPALSELIHRVELHEPLSASDQVVAEMFAVPPALQVSRKSTTTNTTMNGVFLGDLSSLGDMVRANIDGADFPTTHTCCVEEIEMLDSLTECEDADSSHDSDDLYAEIENACLGEEFTLTSALRVAGKPRTSAIVDFDIVRHDRSDGPEHLGDIYRQIIMFKVRPLLAEVRTTWITPRFFFISKIKEERRSWRTRREAHDSVERKYDIVRALARRSAWITNLEPGVGAGDLPKWPVVIQEHETYTFGSCRLPLGEYKGERGQNTYVRNAPVCARVGRTNSQTQSTLSNVATR